MSGRDEDVYGKNVAAKDALWWSVWQQKRGEDEVLRWFRASTRACVHANAIFCIIFIEKIEATRGMHFVEVQAWYSRTRSDKVVVRLTRDTQMIKRWQHWQLHRHILRWVDFEMGQFGKGNTEKTEKTERLNGPKYGWGGWSTSGCAIDNGGGDLSQCCN